MGGAVNLLLGYAGGEKEVMRNRPEDIRNNREAILRARILLLLLLLAGSDGGYGGADRVGYPGLHPEILAFKKGDPVEVEYIDEETEETYWAMGVVMRNAAVGDECVSVRHPQWDELMGTEFVPSLDDTGSTPQAVSCRWSLSLNAVHQSEKIIRRFITRPSELQRWWKNGCSRR